MATKPDIVPDGKQKELIKNEAKAKEVWHKRWAEISTREYYENIIRQESVKLGLDPEFYFNRIQHKKDLKKKKSWVNIKPSPTVPIRSSQMVGWRSGIEYSLEIAGPMFVSRRFTVTPEGREPPEKHDIIVLG